jgi:microcin C transport system substrate-binding protein
MKKIIFIILAFWAFGNLQAAKLPKNIVWKTAEHAPILSSPKAKKGGVYTSYLLSYPLTFRLYGPNSNSGGFVSYNRKYAFWSLITRHPNTSEYLPELATHWSLAKDQKSAYFQLNKDARWSDGEKITADDYVFAFEFLKSPHIQAPFYNQYIRDHIASVEKIDEWTLKVVSVNPSWRLLEEVNLSPLPKHAIVLDKDWVKNYQWETNVVPGPYVIKKFKNGKFIELHRLENWWGKDYPQYKNQFNFDVIRLEVVRNQAIAFELFKKGKLSAFAPTEIQWVKETDIESIKNGYILKHQHPIETWTGIRGILFNTQAEVWSDTRLRKAAAHAVDFEVINKNHLYGFTERKHNFFDVDTPYKAIRKTYEFDLAKSNKLLDEAGWQLSKKDGLRYKNGKKLSLRLNYGGATHNPYLGTIKNQLLKVGIHLELVLQDGSSLFRTLDSGKYQAVVIFFGGGRYPAPRQYLHTENQKPGTNNLFLFGDEKVDNLIEIFEQDLKEQNRIEAIAEIEQIVHDNALLIYFWKKPFIFYLRQRSIQAPSHLGTKRGIDFDLLWYDESIAQEVKTYKKQKKSF